MKCSPRFRRNKRYINPPSRRSDVSSKDACKMKARFRFFARSAFKMKALSLVLLACQIHRMIIPQSVSVRGALQEGL